MTAPFDPVAWRLAHGRELTLGPAGHLMAIINVTPDSFSDGGQNLRTADAVDAALRAIDEGAAIIDIGGESTRPGAAEVSADEEQARVLPVIEALAARTDAILSIDTYRASTADRAIAAGAHLVNDVHGLQRDPALAGVVAASGAGLCIMHTGRGRSCPT
jgi:dihydropteroate synthase